LAAAIAFSLSRASRLLAVTQWRLVAVMTVVVLAIWLVGAAVTKYSLEQMAYYAPIAVVVIGATVGIVLLWVKIVLDSLRRRRES
jgi:hypothetical protein